MGKTLDQHSVIIRMVSKRVRTIRKKVGALLHCQAQRSNNHESAAQDFSLQRYLSNTKYPSRQDRKSKSSFTCQ